MSSIERRGFYCTGLISLMRIHSVIVDVIFDFYFGIDTRKWVDLNSLSIHSDNKKRGINYVPTQVLTIKKLFSELKIPFNGVFVDLGCGKGRVLIVASESGFKDLRGIEFSAELCRIAIKNCEKYKQKRKTDAKFQVFESDVVDYPIKKDENVFYLYNPFDAIVLEKVIKNILLSLSDHPRTVFLIYRDAAHRSVIENYEHFVKIEEFDLYGNNVLVYINKDI